MLLLARAEVLCGYVYDTVRVYIERYLYLRDTAGSGRNAVQTEVADGLVVLCKLTLALKNVDVNARLVVCIGGEHLALFGRNGGVSVYHSRANAARGFDTERQRRYIEKNDAAYFLVEYAALNCSAYGYALVGVNALERLFAKEALYGVLYGGDSCRTAYEQYLVNLVLVKTRVGDSLLQRTHGSLYEVCGKVVELRP